LGSTVPQSGILPARGATDARAAADDRGLSRRSPHRRLVLHPQGRRAVRPVLGLLRRSELLALRGLLLPPRRALHRARLVPLRRRRAGLAQVRSRLRSGPYPQRTLALGPAPRPWGAPVSGPRSRSGPVRARADASAVPVSQDPGAVTT